MSINSKQIIIGIISGFFFQLILFILIWGLPIGTEQHVKGYIVYWISSALTAAILGALAGGISILIRRKGNITNENIILLMPVLLCILFIVLVTFCGFMWWFAVVP